MDQPRYDRAADDSGNIVEFGHLNVCVPDQRRATDFYVSGLGLTRDPFLMTGTDNMWVNAGRSQFHLPEGMPQRVRGTIGLVVPDLDALATRLHDVRAELRDTLFGFERNADGIVATCPWGNRFQLHAPDAARFGPVRLGIAYLECAVPVASAGEIARFYRDLLGARVVLDAGERSVRVQSGDHQFLVFRETEAPPEAYDRHHIQVYLADFSGPYQRLLARDLVTEENGPHQYRFADIVALDAGRPVYTLEHELRSIRHPLYGRHLVNRDPAVNLMHYIPGSEPLAWMTG